MGPGGEGWEELFWFVFERSANPMAVLDSERRIVEVNPALLALLRRTRGGLIGRLTTDTVHPRDDFETRATWSEFLRRGEESGTRALLRADGSRCEVEFARRTMTIGGRRLAVHVVTAHLGRHRFTRPGRPDPDALTPREREVVTQISLGANTEGIARELSISPETVRTHVRNAMAKLEVHTRAQLVAAFLSTAVPRLP